MNKFQFNKLFGYLGDDKFCYVIPKKAKVVKATDRQKMLISEIEKLEDGSFLRININMNEEFVFSLQTVVLTRNKSNALLVKPSTLNEVASRLSLNVDSLLLHKEIIYCTSSRFRRQEIRKKEALANREYKEKLKNISYASKKTPKQLVEWANKNQDKLIKKATESELGLFRKLHNTFKQRVKTQHPFLINGHLYYADISIPSLKVIIEVDGGYHLTPEQKEKDKKRDEDFASIGYTTIRVTNEQVQSKKGKQEVLHKLLEIEELKKDN